MEDEEGYKKWDTIEIVKYESLDPRTELEQAVTRKLMQALRKRGFEIKHNGTFRTNTGGGFQILKYGMINIILM